MFEKYNEKARRALLFARYEASKLGSRVIESEHILLGVLREGEEIIKEIFSRFNVKPEQIRREVEGDRLFVVRGQTAKALVALVAGGDRGVSALEVATWAYRLAAYCHELRTRYGLAIRTEREEHPGGWHGRHVLGDEHPGSGNLSARSQPPAARGAPTEAPWLLCGERHKSEAGRLRTSAAPSGRR